MPVPSTNEGRSFLALTFQKERASVVSIENGKVHAIGSQEMVHPFGIDTLRSEEVAFGNLVDVVRKLCNTVKCSGKQVGVVLGQEMVQIKRFPIALGMDKTFLEQQIEWEARQACISDIDGLHPRQQPIARTTGFRRPSLCDVLVRKWIVTATRRLIERAGYRLNDIDVDVFTQIHAVLGNYDISQNDLVLLAKIEADALSLTVIKRRDFFLCHRVTLQKPANRANNRMPAQDMAELIQKEVKRLVFAHRLGNDMAAFSAVFLCGENDPEGVLQALSSSLTVPIKKVNPFYRVRTVDSLTGTEDFVHRPERYMASMGLALKRLPSLSMEMTVNPNR